MKCEEKIRFSTKRDAKIAATRHRQYGRTKNHPYRCPGCGCWHLTSAGAEQRAFFRSASRNGETRK